METAVDGRCLILKYGIIFHHQKKWFFEVLPFRDWLLFSGKWILTEIFLTFPLLLAVTLIHGASGLPISQTGLLLLNY